MKTAPAKHFRLILPVALTALCAWPSAAQAGWGSLHGSNGAERRAEPQAARHEAAPVHHEAAPVHREQERVVERRRLDIEPERRHSFFWWGFHPGMVIAALPPGCVALAIGPAGCYYYDGVYYQATTSGYDIIAPPVGAIVAQLPDGAEPVVVGPSTYYYAAGAFYVQQPGGFAVVPAPLGVVVTALPPGAAPVSLNGALYYLAGNIYYSPVMQNGVTVYVTAHP